MKTMEVLQRINSERRSDRNFIKWWRKEEDFIDFDLVERFKENLEKNLEIAGFELISMDEMWNELKRLCGDRINRDRNDGRDVVIWDREGKERKICTYSPESLINILDVETKGNY